MTVAPPVATIDVAHEARLRRWTYAASDAGYALGSAELIYPGARDARRDAAVTRVGSGMALRVAVLAAAEPTLDQAAHRALLAAAADGVVWLRTDDGRTFGERAEAVRTSDADVVLILAGEHRHGDAVAELAEALRFGCAARSPAPRVLVSGDARTTLRLYGALSGFPIEVLSDPRRADGQAAIVGRAREFRRGASADLVLRDEALEELARALAHAGAQPALVLDVTGETTSLVHCDADGTLTAAHAARLGLGRGGDRVVARAGLDRVRRWIPWAVDAPTLLERVFNRARWPDAVPADALALALEIALAHESVAHVLEDAQLAVLPLARFRAAPRVALTGRLAELPRAAQSVLVALDALQPSAVASIAREEDDALVACGALAAIERLRGRDAVGSIATEVERRCAPLAVAATCEPDGGAVLQIQGGGARRDERVARGAFFRLPISGDVELSARGMRLHGRGRAGACGLIVDARGRPLGLPPRDAERIPTLARWFAALDALPSAGR